ncbi:MAG: MMPL family transporter, partial [Phycisphaeraceae bacterium]
FRRLMEAFTLRLRTPAERAVDIGELVEGEAREWQYLRTENGRFFLLRVTPRREAGALSPYKEAIAEIRAVLEETRAAHPDVAFGLTGIEAIEADETAAATADSTRASVLAVVLIALVLVTAFHSFRVPMMLIAALGIGIGWTFGFAALVVGHLQVISVIFVVLLLGLGIAFGIHLASGFELVRHAYPDTRAGFRSALQQTLERIGPGLLTGAVTTAAAFATTMFTDFRGVAEMGMIAGAGVILCLFAMCSVYPALLRLVKPGHRHVWAMGARRVHLFEERWVMGFVRRPRATLIVAAVVTLASLAAITQMRFDYNLMALMPRGVDSVEWQRRIVEQGEQSVWAATSIVDDLDEARRLTERFRGLETVESVGGVGWLFPEGEARRAAMMEQVRGRVGEAAARVVEAGRSAKTQAAGGDRELLERVAALRLALGLAAFRAPAELQGELEALRASLGAFVEAAGALSSDQRAARLEALRADYQRWRYEVAQRIEQALAPGPVRLSDLPASLLEPYVSEAIDGQRKFALEIYPRLPAGIDDPLDPRFLGAFVRDVYSVDDEATGVVVQIHESGELIWRAYLWAGMYALLAVFVIVAVDFHSFRDAALALVPVAVGFAVTFAVMWLAGVAINPANIIVLPLMFGIGVDAGVHILHRWRQSPHDEPPGLTAGTGKGVTLTSLTTMIGFGALMLASHRGIASLGFVLAVGVGLTMLACWTVMPAWLAWRNERAASKRRLPVVVPPPEGAEVR